LSRENRQTRQTRDHIKKHSTMTKQDRAMRFSWRSSSNSLLESSTCRAPLGRRNGYFERSETFRTAHVNETRGRSGYKVIALCDTSSITSEILW
jgi:hypothetical protein